MIQNVWKHTARYGSVIILAAALLLGTALPAKAEDEQLLVGFIGEWQSNGDAFGRPALSTISFTPVFEGKFVHLEYAIKIIEGDTLLPAFSGAAYYKHVSGDQYQASWADSEGSIHPITATLNGQALTSLWGTENTRQGRTRYEILGDGTMRITDWAGVGNDWRQFNQNVFSRTDANKPDVAEK